MDSWEMPPEEEIAMPGKWQTLPSDSPTERWETIPDTGPNRYAFPDQASTSFEIPEDVEGQCIVCAEDFTSRTRPPAWITLACEHKPTVCTKCIATSIKTDLEDKMWDKIRCPECGVFLIYDDIRRLADFQTFERYVLNSSLPQLLRPPFSQPKYHVPRLMSHIRRYEKLSFRAAISTDPNFVWCQSCNFGQLHSSGSASPIVRCLNCNQTTCFNHQVSWHARLTCAEYDAMLADPDNFVAEMDRSNAEIKAQEERQMLADEKIARDLMHAERLAEQDRQRAQHRDAQRRAREAQEAEAARKREEREAASRRKKEETERKKAETERNQAVEDMKRRAREEQASLKKVGQTTKKCPGCQWPIEKNAGCAHMTCKLDCFLFILVIFLLTPASSSIVGHGLSRYMWTAFFESVIATKLEMV